MEIPNGLEIVYLPISSLTPYERNAKEHPRRQIDQIKRSISDYGMRDPIGIWGKNNVIVEGHGRWMACKELGFTEVPCIRLDDMTDEQRREYALVHNQTTMNSGLDLDVLDLELGELPDFDASFYDFEVSPEEPEIQENEASDGSDFFDREDRFDASREQDNDEYNEFLDKFEQKKTTDDCYTPENVYDVVADYVETMYGVNRERFVRPFFPGGDYQNYKYPDGCVVVDNPPFSILAEIVDFYVQRDIKFFLFAPGLATIGYANRKNVCAICTYASVTYENGACVATSFLSNVGDGLCCAKSAPDLYRKIDEANEENLRRMRKQFPKYEYPVEVVTSAKLGYLSKYGQDLKIDRNRSVMIWQLDAQKEVDKVIFGKAFLLSHGLAAEKAAAEKAAAEKAAAEKAAATVWTLSERELEIIKTLTENDKEGCVLDG